jgi:hypothetical protein
MGLITAMTLTCGIVLAQADLPNANLPGNSPTLPNSNLPGPVTTDHPVMLPNTDTSGYWPAEWQAQRAQETNNAQWMAMHEATMRLAAKAAEDASLARADAANANQALQQSQQQNQQLQQQIHELQQRQPPAAQQPQQQQP